MSLIIYYELIQPVLLINVVFNLLSIIFSIAMMKTHIFDNMRIQDIKKKDNVYNRIPLILFNVLLLQPITTYFGVYLISDYFDLSNYLNILRIGWELLVMFIIDDFYFYWFHRILHINKYLFTNIHQIHHQSKSPYFCDYIYSHPLEVLFGTIGTFLGIIILGGIHKYTFISYTIFRLIHEIEIHSGIKSCMSNYIPYLGRSEEHDSHHLKLRGNFSSTFTYWDKLYNTYIEC